MPSELEQQLTTAFRRSRPTRDATSRARAAALATLPPQPRPSSAWIAVLAAAVLLGVVGLGAAALAATGKLHVVLGAPPPAPPAPTRLVVPPRTHGIALVAGGKLWLATKGGLRIEGMPVSAAELSPRALYAVVGLGSSLVTLAPGGRRPWTHQTPGRVVAAAWSPDGLKIAYVVRRRAGAELRLIEGDGDHDRVLDRSVADVKPSWRRDSLSVVYVRANGRGARYDLAGGRRYADVRAPRALPGWDSAHAKSPLGDASAVAVAGADGALELRIVPRGAEPKSGRLLLRIKRALPSPVSISWR